MYELVTLALVTCLIAAGVRKAWTRMRPGARVLPQPIPAAPALPPVATRPGGKVRFLRRIPAPPRATSPLVQRTRRGLAVTTAVKKCKYCLDDLHNGKRLGRCVNDAPHEIHADCAGLLRRCPECGRGFA